MKCKYEVKIFCSKQAIIAITCLLSIIYVTLKIAVLFLIYLMKKELGFSFFVEPTVENQIFDQNINDIPDQLHQLDDSIEISSDYINRDTISSNETENFNQTFISKFNSKPKEAIKFFFQSICNLEVPKVTTPLLSKMKNTSEIDGDTISQSDATIIANLLLDKKISKIKLGYYLGIDHLIPRTILYEWIKLLDFNNLKFIDAMKLFLNSISLPPETEKIDRLLECFAKQYYTKNPDIVENNDAAYILAVAVLMLHTDAHSPKINKSSKMTKQQFINNLRGLNNGKDFPYSFLSELYDVVVEEEIMMNVVKRGYLEKHSRPERGISKQWKRRYFMLTSDHLLYYFKKKEDKEPRLIIPLESVCVSKAHQSKKKPYCFVIHDPMGGYVKSAKKRSDGSLEVSTHENFLLSAETEEERESWIESINSNILKNPYYQILKRRLSSSKSLFENY